MAYWFKWLLLPQFEIFLIHYTRSHSVMPYAQTTSTENFLRDIDEVLVQYTSLLCSKGYSNTRVLAHLTLPDIAELPIGHRRLLINEVNKIRSPHSKALLTAIDSQELQTAGTESLRPRVISSWPQWLLWHTQYSRLGKNWSEDWRVSIFKSHG